LKSCESEQLGHTQAEYNETGAKTLVFASAKGGDVLDEQETHLSYRELKSTKRRKTDQHGLTQSSGGLQAGAQSWYGFS
jgi:hypothetical protein